MSNSESESTQLIFEETKRLSEIDKTEEEEELKKIKENKSYQLHKEDFDQAEKDLDDLKINDYKLKHQIYISK
jgi:hypothetical protein